jgi:hypothetical protein
MSEEMAKSFCFVVVVVSCSSAQHSLFRIRSPANSQPRATNFPARLGLRSTHGHVSFFQPYRGLFVGRSFRN